MNLQLDPAEMLYAEISRALLGNAGFVARMAERAKLTKVQIGAGASLAFDPAQIGKTLAHRSWLRCANWARRPAGPSR